MSQRHPIQNGVLMLVTTNTWHKQPFFLDPAFAREAIETLYRVRQMRPFLLHGFVMMPDHCHLLIHIPQPERLSLMLNIFKSGVTHNVGLMRLWQAGFYVTYPGNSAIALQYIHANPVKKQLVDHPSEYLWSSASGLWTTDPLP
ncbi:MAG: hypothetical protein JWM56_1023 [Candidatus Peribacteria bacterium]|nr:hypothetical protein [Candidatus Peribacteria bacterium]